MSFTAKIVEFVRRRKMILPGDRVGVAVSGGADSLALLRALLELRGELGCVLAVVHFNHKIRPEAEAEAEFVAGLTQELGLEFFGGEGDTRLFAAQQKVSLETGARELRYGFFSQLSLDKIATAHTLDDQAETVLMKVLRGAGTRGMSGIWPVRQQEKEIPRSARDDKQDQTQGPSTRAKDGRSLGMTSDIRKRSLGMTSLEVIRPMLGVRRKEVEAYLRGLGQEWREDPSNREVRHTRNKVRHELLPLLEREYNPNICQQLADAAEVARAEEEFWEQYLEKQYSAISSQHSEKQVPRSARDDKQNLTQDPSARSPRLGMTSVLRRQEAGRAQYPVPSTKKRQSPRLGPSARAEALARDDNSIDVALMVQQPQAVRRRVVREAFLQASGKSLDFEHTDALVRLLERRESSLLQLPEYWFAVLDWPRRIVTFEERVPVRKAGTTKTGSSSKSVSRKSRRFSGRKV